MHGHCTLKLIKR